MNYKYQIFKVKGQKFIVKLEENPITHEFEYHMFVRHLITPQQAIAAYFSKTSEIYNEKCKRYELYSASLDITVFYIYLKEENILLITAFSQGGING